MITTSGVKFLNKTDELAKFKLLPGEIGCKHCGAILLAEPTAQVFLDVRTQVGRALDVTSGSRCYAHQLFLYNEAVRVHGRHQRHAAHPKCAPHVLAVALDIIVPSGWTQAKFAKLIQDVSKKRFGKAARVGYRIYEGQGFVHFDMAFLLTPNPDPVNFVPGVIW